MTGKTVSSDEKLIYIRIAADLREKILSGTFPPGHRLPSEAALCEEFGASRTSVREALRVLVAQRLIDTSRGATRGSTVRQLDHREVMDMLNDNMRALMIGQGSTFGDMEELRELLEVSATWLAASRRTPEQLARIESCVPDVESTPLEELRLANLQFHYEVLSATGNRLLHLFAEPVLVAINSYSLQQPRTRVYYRGVYEEHCEIVDAIRARDQPRARAVMSRHVVGLHFTEADHADASPFAGLCF